MTSLATKVVLLFKAIAVLLLLGCSMVAVSQWIFPFIFPWEFAAHYGSGAIGVIVAVALGAFFKSLKVKLMSEGD
ncbi:hypothetical protein C7T35_25025 [Variovorax sp. WS11]|uniref:hypothetical protein n=1 Tax=Variovorax sp. WS11 TaxID=1105204 RepID=UPI000D0CB908|nr:hypothetical protein [Variovorax sp. WS11]NDZ15388.1 hypothetical protein [Variovorax sp. WS11]PSL81779.1 hypothetical protein C7T35_25025 [Variovorax sp. WS11]